MLTCLGADDPWQAVAAAMEISEAINSEDPEQFMSNLPVHQDGSCNGSVTSLTYALCSVTSLTYALGLTRMVKIQDTLFVSSCYYICVMQAAALRGARA